MLNYNGENNFEKKFSENDKVRYLIISILTLFSDRENLENFLDLGGFQEKLRYFAGREYKKTNKSPRPSDLPPVL